MKIPAQGVSILQEMLAREAIEAVNLPKLNAGSAAQRAGQRGREHGLHHGLSERQQIDLILETPLHKLRARQQQKKAGKRGSTESPEASASASALDELLMLQEECNNDRPYPVIRASTQKRNDSQGRPSGQPAQTVGQAVLVAPAKEAKSTPLPTVLEQIVRSYAVAAATATGGASRYAALETAMLQIRAMAGEPGSGQSSTYSVLRVMQEHFSQEADSDAGPATLAAVRDKLLKLLPAAAGASVGNGGPQASAVERQMNLFLPILLLNVTRPRTELQRTQALAKIAVLLRRSAG